MRRLARALAVAFAVAGCTSGELAPPPPPTPVVFTADGIPSEGPAVFLRGRPEDGRIAIDVVARGAPDLHGVAFRLSFDPNALAFTSAGPRLSPGESPANSAWSKSVVAVAKEGTPGQLAVTWTERGAMSGMDATNETVLGTVLFEARGASGSPITFRAERSKVVDRTGTAVTVAWRGGSVLGR